MRQPIKDALTRYGITSADFPTMLALDPFAQWKTRCPIRTVSWQTNSSIPTSPPLTPNGVTNTTQVTITNETSTTHGHSVDHQYSVGATYEVGSDWLKIEAQHLRYLHPGFLVGDDELDELEPVCDSQGSRGPLTDTRARVIWPSTTTPNYDTFLFVRSQGGEGQRNRAERGGRSAGESRCGAHGERREIQDAHAFERGIPVLRPASGCGTGRGSTVSRSPSRLPDRHRVWT